MDYVTLWLIKGADYIVDSCAELAFVTTNSITQGEQVGMVFPILFDAGLEIGYAYRSFGWENNAKRKAGITVVVISLRNVQRKDKYLFIDDVRLEASNINGYLADGPNVSLARRTKPLSQHMPRMSKGNQPTDRGGLMMSSLERAALLKEHPEANTLILRVYGSREFIQDIKRYCIWITPNKVDLANSIPKIRERMDKVAEHRRAQSDPASQRLADEPWRFREQRETRARTLVVPEVSSELRRYVPMGYADPQTILTNKAQVIWDADIWVFALLTSRMHMVWTRAVAGRMEMRFQYSNTIVYNNFPVPELTEPMRDQLTERALRVLDVREYHSERTLAELYAADKMPENLRRAHQELDALVDSVYRNRPFDSDEDRLSLLFDLHSKMTAQEAK